MRILVVEDEKRIADFLTRGLQGAGYAVDAAADGATGLHLIHATDYDLVILDLMLPDMDGLQVCRVMRARAATPILMLTARGDTMDRVVGLELGADDYLPKPFEPRELLARLKAILRRGRGEPSAQMLRFGRLEIDLAAREVRLDGDARALTSYQFDLLAALAQHAGRVMSRDAIMNLVRNEPLEAFDRSIDVHISRIVRQSRTTPGIPGE
jgi:two-component system, OmpR family, phosphate regulon response regulator OmpR